MKKSLLVTCFVMLIMSGCSEHDMNVLLGAAYESSLESNCNQGDNSSCQELNDYKYNNE